MRKMLLLAVFLVLVIGFASAQIELISPKDNETVTIYPQSFIFSITEEYRAIGITNCTLFIDDAPYKTYNFFPTLLNIKINAELDKGMYSWYVICYAKNDKLLRSDTRNIIGEPPETGTAGVAEIKGSGMTSYGTRWKFDISLLNKQEVVLSKIRPLDIIEITLKPRSYSTAFQSKEEYFEIYIIKAGAAESRSFLDIKAGGSANKRAYQNEPLKLDVDKDEENEIAFEYRGQYGKEYTVAINNLQPAQETPQEQPQETIIEEEPVTQPVTEETPPEEPQEEPEETTPPETTEKASNKGMVIIVLVIIVLVVVIIGIYMYMTGKMNAERK